MRVRLGLLGGMVLPMVLTLHPVAAQIETSLKDDTLKSISPVQGGEKSHPLSIDRKGVLYRSSGNAFGFSVDGYAQFDSRWFVEGAREKTSDNFNTRRLRPDVRWWFWDERILFRVSTDHSGGSRAYLRDAYMDINLHPAAELRIGKIKPPLNFERQQSGSASLFAERGLTSNLAPSRDLGIEFGGKLFAKKMEYDIALLNGSPDTVNGDLDEDNNREVAARLFFKPFRADGSMWQGMGIGIAGSYGEREGSDEKSLLGGYRTTGQQRVFRYRNSAGDETFADGEQWRVIPQGYLFSGPFGVLADVAWSGQEIRNGVDAANVTHTAWQVATTYVLTGERASYRGVKPAQPFEPWQVGSTGLGAWEVALRVGQLDVDDAVFPVYANPSQGIDKATEVVAGLNWHWNDNLKLMLNYAYTAFDEAPGAASRDDEQAVITRIQVKW